MADCCNPLKPPGQDQGDIGCPRCGNPGKKVPLITLKSLLLPEALVRLEPASSYRLCLDSGCNVAYFNKEGTVFTTSELKVPVWQKTADPECPVCYCFGWTPARIKKEIEKTGTSRAVDSITEHVRAGRCGCDVNNPQGSCCLGDVNRVIRELLLSG
ncbi:MAG: (2Fe-2S)-binding protein [Clostridia bacterium]|nr:MAG: (2Fe-2S)-binding protein [Clostridia bacterium]